MPELAITLNWLQPTGVTALVVFTSTFPATPLGTTTVIWVGETSVTVAAMPSNVAVVVPSNTAPVMVTVVPGVPHRGLMVKQPATHFPCTLKV